MQMHPQIFTFNHFSTKVQYLLVIVIYVHMMDSGHMQIDQIKAPIL